MKVCPVCNESFGDEFSFCDIDGTRLRRDPASAATNSRVGSMLGVGLIVAAVVISVVVVKGLIQKPPVAPVVARSNESQANSNVAKAAPAETADTTLAEAGDAEANINAAPVAPRKQDRNQNANANISAAPGAETNSATRPEPTVEPVTPQPEPAAIAPPPVRTEAPIVETRAPETTKTAEPPAEKREIKQAATKKDDKDSDKKKDEGKEKKKGGGLLRAFKKIFGKD